MANIIPGRPPLKTYTIDSSMPSGATTIGTGLTTVTTAGTAVSLGNSTACKQVTVQAKSTNTGNIYVGTTNVSSSNGIVIWAGSSITISIDNINKIYIDADVNGEGVTYLYLN